ncbi:MAG: tRNA (adenosine(37)-N6)-dimethylallyltransferase MiaA [Tannerellaceae bacterium]|jgi:tRNA dimethylallyltransferase|nr:tRNA (adenosine(37)-N6)-dimethylallyltransferase MiaA [Tannerellaceae bacterium]
MKEYRLITVLGPTASGKTAFAAALAARLGSEVISGDSRQVYRRMDIGTGKDLADYIVDGLPVPYHLIDICEPGEKYNVFRFQHDFHRVFAEICSRGKLPVLCGGSGLYIESVLRGYEMPDVPPNPALRERLKDKSVGELASMLAADKALHNTTDLDSPQRVIRAIEIEEFRRRRHSKHSNFPSVPSLNICLLIGREQRWERIGRRLRERLEQGLADEIRGLLDSGLSAESIMYYGLEYKFVTLYVTGALSLAEMLDRLETNIRQFAKRQMTWFRGMERRGCIIQWIDALMPVEEKVESVLHLLNQQ